MTTQSGGGAQRPILLIAFFVVGTIGCGNTPSAAQGMPETAAPACLLQLPLREIDLGTIRQGGTFKKQLEIYNPGPGRVEVVSISTSCPCLHVKLTEQVLEPDQKAWCLVELDMAREPDFTGNLRMQVEGQTAQGVPALRLTVLVRVHCVEK